MTEVWRDITNYEDTYQISNLGNVRSKDRVVLYIDKRKRIFPGQTMKLNIDTKGYYKVNLRKNNKFKSLRIHKLVAEHFLKKEIGKNIVNHKDGNKLNNCVDNLEFVTISENTIHAIRVLKKDFTNGGKHSKKPIISIQKNNIYRFFDSVGSASKFFDLSRRTIGRKMNNPSDELYFIWFENLDEDNFNKIVNKQDILDIKYKIKK